MPLGRTARHRRRPPPGCRVLDRDLQQRMAHPTPRPQDPTRSIHLNPRRGGSMKQTRTLSNEPGAVQWGHLSGRCHREARSSAGDRDVLARVEGFPVPDGAVGPKDADLGPAGGTEPEVGGTELPPAWPPPTTTSRSIR